MRRVVVAVCGVVVGAALACTDLSGLTGSTPDAGADATAPDASADGGGPDSGADAPEDAAIDAPADAIDPRRGSCAPVGGASSLVDGGDFCIEASEVTQAQYAAFLAAADAGGQLPECAWNQDFQPAGSCVFSPVARATYPVTGIDWCDAFAYCRWIGRRLCGRIRGGGLRLLDRNDATRSQWFAACSNHGDGLHRYPYGPTANASSCNAQELDAGATLPVASLAGCTGGISPQLYDMSGNAAEWEDACDPIDGGNSGRFDTCTLRGGDFGTSTGSADCNYVRNHFRGDPACDVGFRCCGDSR
jgi:formylglycine-generating enzyme required for sulfatase activity